eukprot:scaffold1318_cov388-Prasinococcus_capsulatus_cf.AAC.5
MRDGSSVGHIAPCRRTSARRRVDLMDPPCQIKLSLAEAKILGGLRWLRDLCGPWIDTPGAAPDGTAVPGGSCAK